MSLYILDAMSLGHSAVEMAVSVFQNEVQILEGFPVDDDLASQI
jgi:hypothetical protein